MVIRGFGEINIVFGHDLPHTFSILSIPYIRTAKRDMIPRFFFGKNCAQRYVYAHIQKHTRLASGI